MIMECPVCKSDDMVFLYDAGPLDYSLPGLFAIYRCKSCGHGVTAGIPENSDALYNQGHYESGETFIHKVIRPLLNLFEKRKVKFIKHLVKGSRLLEIGCGKGYFLKMAQDSGFIIDGIEPSDRSRNFAQNVLGLDVHSQGLLEYATVTSQNYDVIYLWHVLEHLEELPTSISAIKKLLREDGIAVFGVPNFASIQSWYAGRDWYHLDPPRHINHFTPSSIKTLLSEHGLENIHVYQNSYFQDLIGEIVSLTNRICVVKNLPVNLLKRNPATVSMLRTFKGLLSTLAVVILSPVIVLFAIMLFIISHVLGKAGTMVVVASSK